MDCKLLTLVVVASALCLVTTEAKAVEQQSFETMLETRGWMTTLADYLGMNECEKEELKGVLKKAISPLKDKLGSIVQTFMNYITGQGGDDNETRRLHADMAMRELVMSKRGWMSMMSDALNFNECQKGAFKKVAKLLMKYIKSGGSYVIDLVGR